MSYIIKENTEITLPFKAKNCFTEELLRNYTYGQKWNITYTEAENVITVGNAEKADLIQSHTVININDNGVYICGIDFSATMRGFITFLDSIKYNEENDYLYLENGCMEETPKMNFIGVHLCVFPETDLYFLKKCIRSCAIAKYSHIILEFWGMLKHDCLKELSWPFAYSKNEIKELVAEANALGVEIIPMFNHLGHASACRGINGKHVVLDQNPKLEYMFESYGWIWKIQHKKVKELLSKIRDELIEVCGPGEYFHLGCDEVYAYGHNTDNALKMVEYINEVSKELSLKGRKAILWHDMLVSKSDFDGYEANSSKEVADILIEKLDRNIIIADWQYGIIESESWKTSEFFKEKGFNVLCCPWENENNIASAVNTVVENKLNGIIHTTWHTLFKGFSKMIYAAVLSYGTSEDDFYCASIARKVMPSNGDYTKSGWSEKMVGPGLQ